MEKLIKRLREAGVVLGNDLFLEDGVTVDVGFFENLFSDVEKPLSYNEMMEKASGRGYEKYFAKWKDLEILT